MVQASITSWLKKPLGVREPAISIPSRPEPPAPASFTQQAVRQPSQTQPQDSTSLHSGGRQSLPSNVTLSPITPEYITAFKRINQLLLQIPYPKKFYDELLEDETTKTISSVALWHDVPLSSPKPFTDSKTTVVAAIRCRLLGPSSDPMLYISTLTCLSPYRGHGLATALLAEILTTAVQLYGVKSVTAHVWEANEEGRTWYAKRGFVEESYDQEYYKKLNPSGAFLVRKWVRVGDLLGEGFVGKKSKDKAQEKD